MNKTSSKLQDMRRRIYLNAKATSHGSICKTSGKHGGVGPDCVQDLICSLIIESGTSAHRKHAQCDSFITLGLKPTGKRNAANPRASFESIGDGNLAYVVAISLVTTPGLQLETQVPQAKTIFLFSERLKVLNLVDELFAQFHEQLAMRGYGVRAGQMIDAMSVVLPCQRNSREENAGQQGGRAT